MRGAPPLALALMLAGCGSGTKGESVRESDETGRSTAPQSVRVESKGRVIDMAEVLSPEEEELLGQRLSTAGKESGPAVIAVTVIPQEGDTMERIGWAVGGSAGANRPILLLINPESSQVRVEGDISPEQRAAVAGAMQPDLRARRYAQGIARGVDRLEALAR